VATKKSPGLIGLGNSIPVPGAMFTVVLVGVMLPATVVEALLLNRIVMVIHPM
jgi:hypothetical protein